MAEKEKKKGKKALLTAVLIPIMIIVLVAGAFFAIIAGMIKIIEAVVTNIIEFLKHPLESIKIGLGTWNNFWNKLLETGEFDPNEYLEHRFNPSVVIGDEQFKEMKANLESVVSMQATGLDDLTIKKMLLCYYRSVYLTDTNVLMELTKEECEENNIDISELVLNNIIRKKRNRFISV